MCSHRLFGVWEIRGGKAERREERGETCWRQSRLGASSGRERASPLAWCTNTLSYDLNIDVDGTDVPVVLRYCAVLGCVGLLC